MAKNIFEYAAEQKLRFPYNGMVSIEDLYDLTTVQLDSIYKELKREYDKASEESLLQTKSIEDVSLSIKIKIVKHIVEDKLAQIEARNKAADIREQKNKIISILSKKQDDDLSAKSTDELQQMLESLNDM